MMKDDGKCGDICGDGILIDLQCDDGNTISGDGCSSNCVIEKGWACNLTNSTSTKSLCSLIDVPVISVIKFSKQGGSNKINAVLEMSLPILFSHSNLFIAINGLSTNSYSYTVKQQ
jgi:cysteine-rich repeat protein